MIKTTLCIDDALDIRKSLKPNLAREEVNVFLDDEILSIESKDEGISIQFTEDEMRAIMRLFDVQQDDGE